MIVAGRAEFAGYLERYLDPAADRQVVTAVSREGGCRGHHDADIPGEGRGDAGRDLAKTCSSDQGSRH